MRQTNDSATLRFAQALIHNTIWHPLIRIHCSPAYTPNAILSYVQDSISCKFPEMQPEDIFCRRNGRSLAVFIKSRHKHLQDKIEDALLEILENTALRPGEIEYTDTLLQLPIPKR